MAKILLVEDDTGASKMIAEILLLEHYTVESVFNGQEAYAQLRAHEYDLAILDWSLPLLSGIDVCQQYRSHGGCTRILMLTGKVKTEETVEALNAGADDYLTKPFQRDELLARVRSLLRRGESKFSSNSLIVDEIRLEPDKFLAFKGDEELKLVPKEFAILELLMRYQGKVFSAEAIVDRVWKHEAIDGADVVRTHIMNLRRKVGGGESFIRTVRGVGYKIAAKSTANLQ